MLGQFALEPLGGIVRYIVDIAFDGAVDLPGASPCLAARPIERLADFRLRLYFMHDNYVRIHQSLRVTRLSPLACPRHFGRWTTL